MANSKPSLPSAQVFSSDPLEQIYANQLPSLDGLAYMFLANTRARREEGAKSYMEGVDRANKMSMMLGQLEEQAKLREAAIKGAVDLIAKGYNPGDLQAGGDLFSNVPGGDAVAKLFQNKLIADANQSNAAAAHAGAGSADTFTVDAAAIPGSGSDPIYTVKGKGRNMESVSRTVQERINQLNTPAQRPGAPGAQRRPYTQQELDAIERARANRGG